MMTQEAAMGCEECIQIMKRRSTKRPRQSSPLNLGGRGGGGGGSDYSGEFDAATAIPASSGQFKDSTQEEEEEEEEDMANCLILLGQGKSQKLSKPIVLRAYECKTCARCFPSFQALGGHRASHKKSPIGDDEKKKSLVLIQEEEEDQIDGDRTALSLQTPSHRLLLSSSSNYKKKYSKKVHECSICGAEFSSGQALGGHMRRHRTTTSTSDHREHDQFQRVKKSKNNFSFDLNLPAPEDDDDHHRCNSPFASEGQVIVFSASSLVDCHY